MWNCHSARVTWRSFSAFAIVVCLSHGTIASPRGQQAPSKTGLSDGQSTKSSLRLSVIVRDENGNPVGQARLEVYTSAAGPPIRAVTDTAGRVDFPGLPSNPTRLVAEKEGYYALTVTEFPAGGQQPLEVELSHTEELKQSVEVKASTEGIDPAEMAEEQTLNATEILELPYTTTRDIRTALPLLPGVLPDLGGQIHLNGSASNETLYVLDGFDISEPATGLLELRVSTDAVRSIDAEGSRVSAQYGRGSAGVLALETSMGDDHFRFYATDFVPSVQQYKGLHLQNATPRFAFSGPIKKQKAWFYEAVDGEFDENIYDNLPENADRDDYWRFSNLLRTQINLTQGNRLITSLVEDRSRDDHAGLSLTQPLSTTTTDLASALAANVKDQISWADGGLFEVGFGYLDSSGNNRPLGDQPYVEIPGSALGNFYLTSRTKARRYEIPANLYFPPRRWHGAHQLLVGLDLERTNYDQLYLRNPFQIETCSSPFTPPGCTAANSDLLVRSVTFQGNASFSENDSETAAFIEDRWSPAGRVLLEPGLRFEYDSILGKTDASPRMAATVALTGDGETKLSAGVALLYDRVDLNLLGLALSGARQDVFYAPDGVTPISPPIITQFEAAPSRLARPRSLNWSVGLERKLPAAVFLKTEFIEKRGSDGFDYTNVGGGIGPGGIPASGLFVLQNQREDRYDGVTISARHTFGGRYPVMISYTWSRARTNTDLTSTLDNPLYGSELPGPLSWDSPNRLLGWGWLPLVRGFTLGYTLDGHTGYPFSLTNQDQELVGLPNRKRFPDFWQVDIHIEKQFLFRGYQWALRGGFNDITGSLDPFLVDNNIDSPTFGKFTGLQHRAFTGRIRFIGRKK
jgi:TonB dependent receptor/Carboxypeptidase regulatory-like domain